MNQMTFKKKNYLISRLKNRFYRTSTKSNLQLPDDLKEIIIGNMLGDLSAEALRQGCAAAPIFDDCAERYKF